MSDPGPPWFRSNYFAVVLALVLCLGCLGVACSVPALISLSPELVRGSDALDVIPLCAWARNGRAGLWWNSYITPAAPVTTSRHYNAVCIAAPWPASLPDRGRPNIDFIP